MWAEKMYCKSQADKLSFTWILINSDLLPTFTFLF